ncbi:hypothetical protein EMPS_10593 [Entomortierella parvispora]|uniref:Uncharacterized protein n=1 Tax=Entomortierella parvispora TaxID=205924 RepID=A0A9P3M1B8_9FUNG|nr:hypothetical protein EMPS_10593 [Entomortierella parvispora]
MSSSQSTLAAANALLSSWREALALTPEELRPILIACTITAANFPKLLVPLVQQALSEIQAGTLSVPAVASDASTSTAGDNKSFADQVRFVRRLRESLYKGSVLCGGPYGINALGALNFALDPELSDAVNAFGPVRGPENKSTDEEYLDRGRKLFQTIYQHHTDPILTRIGNSSQDLVQGILRDTYGKVFPWSKFSSW